MTMMLGRRLVSHVSRMHGGRFSLSCASSASSFCCVSSAGRVVARALSSAAAASSAASSASEQPRQPQFDGEVAELYAKVFEQLRPSWCKHIAHVTRHAKVKKLSAPKVLDVASGPGQPAITIAQRMPMAQVTSTDVSPDMVAQASNNVTAAGVSDRVTCKVLDMQSMVDVGTGTVDVATVSFGLMFAPQLDLALAEIYRVLKPGGIMTATVWLEMPWMDLNRSVMKDVLGEEPPPPPIDPLSLSELAALDKPMSAAGFRTVDDETGDIFFDFGDDAEFAFKLGTIPFLPKLKELQEAGSHGDVFAKARASFDAHTRDFVSQDGRMRLPRVHVSPRRRVEALPVKKVRRLHDASDAMPHARFFLNNICY
ncbi:ubiquinone/menaquinone biosynthesis C-methyltransferase UbiE [Pycnococcus provasolii]